MQLVTRGVTDERVLAAMRKVPRHLFVPADQRAYAYDDRPLSIGAGQTISQPLVVAHMTEVIEPRAAPGGVAARETIPVRFVPMIGEEDARRSR